MRWTLVTLNPERHLFVLTNHHILMDGWSTPVLLGELWAQYGSSGDSDALPRGRPYADYLAWLGRRGSGTGTKNLAGVPGRSGGTDAFRPRRRMGTSRWRRRRFAHYGLSAELTACLRGCRRTWADIEHARAGVFGRSCWDA